MTNRKKKGLGLIISGVVSVGAGGVIYATSSTPAWVGVVVACVSLACSMYNIYFIEPNTSTTE